MADGVLRHRGILRRAFGFLSIGLLGSFACASSDVSSAPACVEGLSPATCPPPLLDREALLNPQTCKNCRVEHYEQWSGSMLTWTAATSDRIYFEDNQPYQCISTTNLNTQSDTVPAPERPKNFCWP